MDAKRRDDGEGREFRLLPIRVGRVCDVGCVRDNNEDAMGASVVPIDDARPDGIRAVLVVADGMGGHSYGGMASRIAVEATLEKLNAAGAAGLGDSRLASVVSDAIHHANGAIRTAARALGAAEGAAEMGTTLTTVAVVANTISVGHVGDTRAYLIRRDEIAQLTNDHTWAEEEIRRGRLAREDAARYDMRHYLTRSLGTSDDLEVDAHAGRVLRNGDVLVLCSDGLTGHVTPEEIVACVHATADPQAAAEKMLQLANARGGSDNVTALVAEVGTLKRRAALARPVRSRGRGALVAGLVMLILGAAGGAVWLLWPAEPEPIARRTPAGRPPAAPADAKDVSEPPAKSSATRGRHDTPPASDERALPPRGRVPAAAPTPPAAAPTTPPAAEPRDNPVAAKKASPSPARPAAAAPAVAMPDRASDSSDSAPKLLPRAGAPAAEAAGDDNAPKILPQAARP